MDIQEYVLQMTFYLSAPIPKSMNVIRINLNWRRDKRVNENELFPIIITTFKYDIGKIRSHLI